MMVNVLDILKALAEVGLGVLALLVGGAMVEDDNHAVAWLGGVLIFVLAWAIGHEAFGILMPIWKG